MPDSTVSYTAEGPIGVLTLNRPDKLNALSPAMGRDVQAAIAVLASDENLRAVLVTGSGAAFSAGGDLAFLEENATLGETENRARMRQFYAQFLAIRELPVPTIAVMQGRATGAGLSLALACDLRVAEEDAIVSANFVRLGLTPGMGITYTLGQLVGAARAAELLLTGRDVAMGEALAIGLVNHLAPRDQLEAKAWQIARAIAVNGPQAVRLTKRLLMASAPHLESALGLEAQAQATCFGTADYREGLLAIRERRMPRFTGH